MSHGQRLGEQAQHEAQIEVLPNGHYRSTCSCGWQCGEYEAQPDNAGARLAALMGVGHVNEKEYGLALSLLASRDQRIKELEGDHDRDAMFDEAAWILDSLLDYQHPDVRSDWPHMDMAVDWMKRYRSPRSEPQED